jgi:large subunit ribosomal protein L23
VNANDVIVRPVISEKTTAMMEENKYVFRVMMDANRAMVKKAIIEIFGVTPKKVNIMIVRGKLRRLRYKTGKKTAWKKAIVTLRGGDKIEIFEGN